MPEDYQVESISRVLKNIKRRARANAVATSPYVMAPSDAIQGQRQPPIDAGAGGVRLLDRPLWGKHELYTRSSPSFVPELRLYRGLRYQPSAPDSLTHSKGHIVGDFLKTARAENLKTYFQIQSLIPPDYIVTSGGPIESDKPRLPDGSTPPRRVGNTGSLASPDIRRYTETLIADLWHQYPEVDGLRVDWPEYPQYFLDDAFYDFSAPAREAAARLGFSFETMRREAQETRQHLLTGLTNRDLESNTRPLFPWIANTSLLSTFKAALSEELLAGIRQALTKAASKNKQLIPNAFPPPFHLASGMDYARAARHVEGISVKLYTMHWPMIVRFYGNTIGQGNPKLNEALLLNRIAKELGITDGRALLRPSDFHYPAPDQPHPVGEQAQADKIHTAQRAAGDCPVYALVHGYGPLEDFKKRLAIGWAAASGRMWINRYGYLTDEKLDAIGKICV